MLAMHLLTGPDTTLAWLFYVLLGLLLVISATGALIGGRNLGRQNSETRRSSKKARRAAMKAAPEKKLAK